MDINILIMDSMKIPNWSFRHEAVKAFYPIFLEMPYSSTKMPSKERHSLEKLKINKRKLQTIQQFDFNWNGYNGEPFDESLISKVDEIISNLDYQPQVSPTGRGSIQLDVFIDDNNLIEIEISNEDIFAYQVKNGEELERSITKEEINVLISELYV